MATENAISRATVKPEDYSHIVLFGRYVVIEYTNGRKINGLNYVVSHVIMGTTGIEGSFLTKI